MGNAEKYAENKSNLWINIVSIVIPLVVAVLLGIQNKLYLGEWTKVLPHFIGTINSLTAVVLIAGFVFIKQNKVKLHRFSMISAFSLGGLFLVIYVLYHLTNPAKRYEGEGFARYIYFFALITHIALSLVVLPFVLRAMYFALTNQFERHKKVVKFAYPIWLYVAITGVIVYLLAYQL
jgi:putative membrane protein